MKVRSRLVTRLAARMVTTAFHMLMWTVRVEFPRGDKFTPYVEPEDEQRYIFCLWHDAIALALFCRPPKNLCGLISQHQDGSYLAEAARMVNVLPIRGSASRGGARATKRMMEVLESRHICITPDGPRGPREEVKEGIVYLASRTQRPIVVTACVPSRCWRFPGNWTDLLIPKPFSRLVMVGAEPIDIPPDLSREQIADYRDRIQAAMDALNRDVTEMVSGKTPPAAELRKAA